MSSNLELSMRTLLTKRADGTCDLRRAYPEFALKLERRAEQLGQQRGLTFSLLGPELEPEPEPEPLPSMPSDDKLKAQLSWRSSLSQPRAPAFDASSAMFGSVSADGSALEPEPEPEPPRRR